MTFFPAHIRNRLTEVDRGHRTPCLEWTGKVVNGYGQIWTDGRWRLVHRLVYELVNGIKLQRKQMLLHSCDNAICANWEHVAPGTHKQNMLQRDQRGRTARGTDHGMSKIDEHDVRLIRRLRREGWSIRDIGGLLEISHTQAHRIAKGTSWRHIA